jgi:uncharacterized protein (TIGR02246 family)
MRLSKIAAVLVFVGGAALLSACAPSTEADEAAIREQNKKWLEAIAAKDAKTVAALYAEEGQLMPPNAVKAVGREAIEKGWAGMFGIPGMSLSFETETFVFAKSADLAVDIGNYKFTAGEGAAAQVETGKSVVTWTKRNGKWYVLTDMFSSDAPPAPPAAAAADPAATPAAADAATTDPAAPAPATLPGN